MDTWSGLFFLPLLNSIFLANYIEHIRANIMSLLQKSCSEAKQNSAPAEFELILQ